MPIEETASSFLDTLSDTPESTPADLPAPDTPDNPPGESVPGGETANEFLDTLMADGGESQTDGRPRDAQGRFLPKEAPDPSAQPVDPAADPNAPPVDPAANPDPAAQAKPEDQTPKTLEQQEAEALEGIKSERGRERIKAVFAERRELEQQKTQLEADIGSIREMVQSTNMAPEEFAQLLEVARLMKSSDPQQAQLALQMIEQQRAQLAKQLGVEVPGVDPLDDFPQLKQAVENLELTREHALQLARYQAQDVQQRQRQAAQQQQAQQQQQYQSEVANVAKTAESYFKTREHEADYPAKMAQIAARFKDPAFMQEFVSTYEPRQWFAALKMLYDSVAAPQAQQTLQQPIRNRPQHAGAPVSATGESGIDRLHSIAQSIGI